MKLKEWLNLPFDLDVKGAYPETTLFRASILWKVEVDDKYQNTALWDQGFPSNGIFFTYDGSGWLEVPGQKVKLLPGTLFIIKNKTPCRYGCVEKGLWKFYCLVYERFAPLTQFRMDYNTFYCVPNPALFKPFFRNIEQEAIVRKHAFKQKIDTLLHDFLITYSRAFLASKSPSGDPIDNTLNWMHSNKSEPLNMEGLILKSKLCRTNFFKAFIKKTGKTPVQFFNDLKLESARMMIDAYQGSFREISQSLGFYDEYYFSRMFKKKYAVSPLEYRKVNRNNN